MHIANYSGNFRGLLTHLLCMLATTLNARIGREIRAMKLSKFISFKPKPLFLSLLYCAGDFVFVYNPNGTLAYVIYYPDTAKRDQGDTTTTAGADAFKRPIALRVGDGNNKWDLANVLAHVRLDFEITIQAESYLNTLFKVSP